MMPRSAFCRALGRSFLHHPQRVASTASAAFTDNITSRIRSLSTDQSHDKNDINHNEGTTTPPSIKNPFSVKQFSYQDPLNLASLLTKEEIAIQSAAHNFCQSELQPQILLANRHEDTLGHEQMRRMGEMGMLGSTIPERYGGAELNYVSYGLIAAEVERVDSSYRSAMSEFFLLSLLLALSSFMCARCIDCLILSLLLTGTHTKASNLVWLCIQFMHSEVKT